MTVKKHFADVNRFIIMGGKMRKFLFVNLVSVLLFISLISIMSCEESRYEILPEEEVNQEQKVLAESIATDILMSMKSGEFKALGEKATLSVQKGLTPAKLKTVYEQVKGMFGEFNTMEYYETCVPKDETFLTVYRFKGKFESSATPEIRVVINKDNKLSGFWIKPWKDDLK